MDKLVSVIIPVYNAEKTIKQAIDSICCQTYNNLEIIIVDDGSNDGSLDIINSIHDERIRVLRQKNQGISIALNNAIGTASGSLIARMDSDDISRPERIEKQVEFLESHEEVVLLGTAINYIDECSEYIARGFSVTSHKNIINLINRKNPFNHPTVMFRRETFDKVGGYDENLSGLFEDQFLWKKMLSHGKGANLHYPLVHYRLSVDQLTSVVETENYKRIKTRIMNNLKYEVVDIQSLRREKEQSIKNVERVVMIKKFATS
ncbi:hypothetical protein BTO00_01800 [Vibrio campbellii]|uniref:glycosyltransferase n=1 Tax=Vibrio campbellii TaxID=680 RepID=UPI000CF3CC55|nr:glycosyltransferase [Vibrio campbellii]PQJ44935.1 hypothetical protein BTO00_01800 [Vibrio campbellii]